MTAQQARKLVEVEERFPFGRRLEQQLSSRLRWLTLQDCWVGGYLLYNGDWYVGVSRERLTTPVRSVAEAIDPDTGNLRVLWARPEELNRVTLLPLSPWEVWLNGGEGGAS